MDSRRSTGKPIRTLKYTNFGDEEQGLTTKGRLLPSDVSSPELQKCKLKTRRALCSFYPQTNQCRAALAIGFLTHIINRFVKNNYPGL
jgi:hypothetical protein